MILAADLGRYVGICAGRRGETPVLSSRELPIDIGACGLEFEGLMLGLLREHEPEVLAWERPFLDFRKKDAQGEIRTQRLYGQSFAMHRLRRQYGADMWWDYPGRTRKRIVGKGNATDDEIIAFARRAGLNPMNDHEADAYVIWCAAGGEKPAIHAGRTAGDPV